jgi:hypothetical protein
MRIVGIVFGGDPNTQQLKKSSEIMNIYIYEYEAYLQRETQLLSFLKAILTIPLLGSMVYNQFVLPLKKPIKLGY